MLWRIGRGAGISQFGQLVGGRVGGAVLGPALLARLLVRNIALGTGQKTVGACFGRVGGAVGCAPLFARRPGRRRRRSGRGLVQLGRVGAIHGRDAAAVVVRVVAVVVVGAGVARAITSLRRTRSGQCSAALGWSRILMLAGRLVVLRVLIQRIAAAARARARRARRARVVRSAFCTATRCHLEWY